MELLEQHQDLEVIGDKGYISKPSQAELRQNNQVELMTLPRQNQKEQVSEKVRRLFNQVRQIIETVNSQLAGLEENYAHSVEGLCARL